MTFVLKIIFYSSPPPRPPGRTNGLQYETLLLFVGGFEDEMVGVTVDVVKIYPEATVIGDYTIFINP